MAAVLVGEFDFIEAHIARFMTWWSRWYGSSCAVGVVNAEGRLGLKTEELVE
jgi:hypothetical protein